MWKRTEHETFSYVDTNAPAHVVIAGGGFAGLEAALALKALADEDVRLTIVAPQPVLEYRPAATIEAFVPTEPRAYDLRAIAYDVDATYHRARLEAVAPQAKGVRLSSGARLNYEALVMAIGARAVIAIPGALTFRDQRDVPLLRQLLSDLEEGKLRRIVFASPPGPAWPMPAYELALLTAGFAETHELEAEILLVSPERIPLEVFGEDASELVAAVLEDRGVQFVGESAGMSVNGDGSLALESGDAIVADRVVAIPKLRGARISGVPASWAGFVPTDSFGRVHGLPDVYAAGDMSSFAIKQGGLATQQSDRIAQVIASRLGVVVHQTRPTQVLRARLVGGANPLVLRAELGHYGSPVAASLERIDLDAEQTWVKVFGRYLTPYLESCEPIAGDAFAAV